MKVNEVFDGNKMFYDSIDVWIMAMKQNGTWVNYYTKIMPISEATKETGRVIETDRFMVLHESYNIGDFGRVLEALENDKMNVCGVEISFDTAKTFRSDRHMEHVHHKWRFEQFRTKYPLYEYDVRPSSTPSLPRDIEEELLSLNKPYTSPRDVMQELLRINFSNYTWGSVRILLPVFLSLTECFFDQNSLKFTAKFHKKMASQIVIGFILRNSDGESKRYSRPLNKDKLKVSGDFCYYEDFEPVDNGISSAEVIFHHSKIPIISHNKEAIRFGLSPTLEIFKNFWSEEYLLSCLNGEHADQAFEWSVATLLTFCGFTVLWIGWRKGRIALGGADILAFYQDTVTVAECTIGSIGTEKIDKLLAATRTVQETLGLGEKSPQKIIPLIFTCSKISPATRKTSQNSGVRIRGPEEIEQIFDAVKRNKAIAESVSLVRGSEYYPAVM